MSVHEQLKSLNNLLMDQIGAGDNLLKDMAVILKRPGPWTPPDQVEYLRLWAEHGEAMKPFLDTNRRIQALLPSLANPNPGHTPKPTSPPPPPPSHTPKPTTPPPPPPSHTPKPGR